VRTRSLVPAALALLALSGCSDPLLFASVEETRICLTLPAQDISAAPPIGDQTVTWSGDLDVGSKIPGLDHPDAVTGSIKMLSLTTAGSTDLSGVAEADVTVNDTNGQATPFMHYTRPAAPTDPTKLEMVLDQDLNLLDRLQAGSLHYTITFTGAPPQVAWTAEVESCFSVRVTVDALKLMK